MTLQVECLSLGRDDVTRRLLPHLKLMAFLARQARRYILQLTLILAGAVLGVEERQPLGLLLDASVRLPSPFTLRRVYERCNLFLVKLQVLLFNLMLSRVSNHTIMRHDGIAIDQTLIYIGFLLGRVADLFPLHAFDELALALDALTEHHGEYACPIIQDLLVVATAEHERSERLEVDKEVAKTSRQSLHYQDAFDSDRNLVTVKLKLTVFILDRRELLEQHGERRVAAREHILLLDYQLNDGFDLFVGSPEHLAPEQELDYVVGVLVVLAPYRRVLRRLSVVNVLVRELVEDVYIAAGSLKQ